jgi:hypothetical protein
VSRTLSDDFEDEDSPGGSLDLDTGSGTSHAGVAGQSSYDAGGLDFDDEFGDDGPKGGDLQLDLPEDSPAALRSKGPPASSPSLKPQQGGLSAPPQPAGPGGVPSRAPAPVLSQQPPASRPSGGFAAGSASSHGPAAPPSSRSMPAGSTDSSHGPASGHGPSAGGAPAAAVQSLAPAPAAPPSAAAVIARYPAPPAKVIEAPGYAVRVILRQLELRANLDSLRRRRSPDVPLYEAALTAYDPKSFRLGVALNCALFAVATVIVSLPVILRFVRAD